MMAGDWHYDHVIPDALGGEPTLENCQVLCKSCHSTKTSKEDVPRIAKAERNFRQNSGIKKAKGRPIPGSKASGLRKRFDGTVERRQ
jgi:5-methylcytosine-specific restriction endonuclease McrA